MFPLIGAVVEVSFLKWFVIAAGVAIAVWVALRRKRE
jgi:hypothetical protein